ncbi:MAG: hypothetical protein RIR26_1315 [Pseudomonadota bacterium]
MRIDGHSNPISSKNGNGPCGAVLTLFFVLIFLSFPDHSALAKNSSGALPWLDGRGRLALLRTMLQTDPTAVRQAKKDISRANDDPLRSCFTAPVNDDSWFEHCSGLIFDLARQGATAEQRASVARVWTMALRPESRGNWKSWFKLSAALALMGEEKSARESLEKARTKIDETSLQDRWIMRRIEFLAQTYDLLFGENQGDASPHEISTAVAVHNDPLLEPFAGQLQSILARYGPLSRKSTDQGELSFSSDFLRRERWRVDLDLESISSLQSRIAAERNYLDVFPLVSRFSRTYLPEDREWKAISSVIVSTNVSSSILERKGGLLLAMDSWLAAQERLKSSKAGEHGFHSSRLGSVVREFAVLVSQLLDQLMLKGGEFESVGTAGDLKRRFDGLNTIEGMSMLNFDRSASTQVANKIREEIAVIDRLLGQSRARLALLDVTSGNDPSSVRYAGQFMDELEEMDAARAEFISDLFSTAAAIDAQAKAESLSLQILVARLKKSMTDLKSIAIDESQDEVARYRINFFDESRLFLEELEKNVLSEQSKRMALMKSLSQEITNSKKEVAKINDDFSLFVTESSSELRRKILSYVAAIHEKANSKKRDIEFLLQMAKSRELEKTREEKTALQKTRDSIETRRRIRRENLEWRFAQ